MRAGERGASTPARIAAVAAVLVAFVVVAVLLFGGSDGYKYTLMFQTGGQIVPGNEVLVAGQRVGMVDSIDLTDNNEAAIAVNMRGAAARGHHGADPHRPRSPASPTATSRSRPGPTTLPRSTRVDDLRRGHDLAGRHRPALQHLPAQAARPPCRSSSRATPPSTRARAELANRAYKFLNPALSTSTQLFAELSSDSAALSRFLVSGSQTFGALADRRRTSPRWSSTANTTLGAIASRNEDLDRIARRLPGDAAPAQHDAGQPAGDPRRPRSARRGLLPRDEEPRAVPPQARARLEREHSRSSRSSPTSPGRRAPTTTSPTR